MKNTILTALLTFILCAFTNPAAYKLFDKNGEETDYEKLLEKAQQADVILFGELHNNPIAHWLQLQLTKDLYNLKNENIILGAEMFEADDQITLNEYLSDKINYKTFIQEAKVWPNNTTDYQPLVDFAKNNQLPFIATNVPRRYANMVYKNGFETLNDIDKLAKKNWIAPLPVDYDPNLPGYKKMIEMMGGHGGDNLPKAQALKDATMAYFIAENWKKDKIFIHFNGAYHSDNYEGIMWYLKNKNKKLNILTISTVEQTDVSNLADENKNKADFIIVVPEDMTKTH
jgi:uncharacterized iron-regulated protein